MMSTGSLALPDEQKHRQEAYATLLATWRRLLKCPKPLSKQPGETISFHVIPFFSKI